MTERFMLLRTSLSFYLRLGFLAAVALAIACRSSPNLPATSSPEYRTVVSKFYVGLSAMQVGDDQRAETELKRATELAPGEPASWANWGLLATRRREFDQAAQRLEKARSLAPENAEILMLLGVLESSRGKSADAIAQLRRAVELDPKHLKALYLLSSEIERAGGENAGAEAQKKIQRIVEIDPQNLAALLELTRLSARNGDVDTLKRAVNSIGERTGSWPVEIRAPFESLRAAAQSSNPKDAATRVAFLRNVLLSDPDFRRSLSAIKTPPEILAEPFGHFLKLASPASAPAAPDDRLAFNSEPVSDSAIAGGKWNWCGALMPGKDAKPVLICANSRDVQIAGGAKLPFPGGRSNTAPAAHSVLALDYDYDFKNDLVLAGAGGVRLFRQKSASEFSDVTASTKLPASVTGASYAGAWAADIEADGDLDVVLGTKQGVPTILRNNGDDTFAEIHPFNGISGLQEFAWADIDGDGDPDAALIDGVGKLHVFSNERQGQFRERALPSNLPAVRAISVADLNSDGLMDLLVVGADGVIIRISDKKEGREWETAEVTGSSGRPNSDGPLLIADLDNNGGLDLLIAGLAPAIWLSDETGKFKSVDTAAAPASEASDMNGDGRLDLIGVAADGHASLAINHGTKNYHWQVVRPYASRNIGDRRINPFGVGGEMEVRSGLLSQKQSIASPLVHFGLGEHDSADVVRVIWPNGTVSAEFETKADQEIVTEQRLKGSCPFLFAYNGQRMEFVKDGVPWGSAIGLRINTLGSAKIAATEEWYKIGRGQLAPHDGYYDIRITAELWEVYYYDYLSLMTVDHPAGTEIFVDERFVIPPIKLGLTTVATPRPIAHAIDDEGHDVTELISKLDGTALDSFGRGQYQGVTRDHYLEIDLGDDAPKSGPLYLIAHGSIHNTESSVNVAITQGARWQVHGLSLEVPDGRGGWAVAQPNLGFPAGRNKTILFNLTDVFRPGTPRRARIRTNLEIYWDQIEWAPGLPDAELKMVRLDPSVSDLHYRGYSVIHRPDTGAPEIPDYDRISSTTQIWRDMIGYYTRYGEVGELLKMIDDRYVIIASGDEMSLRFPEQPPPPAGWWRDFVIIGDGWIKDGDYNSTFSKTVLPLPYHARNEYVTPPKRLEDELVYRRFPEDWQKYHTRYVTPEVFRNALIPQKPR